MASPHYIYAVLSAQTVIPCHKHVLMVIIMSIFCQSHKSEMAFCLISKLNFIADSSRDNWYRYRKMPIIIAIKVHLFNIRFKQNNENL